MCMCMCMCIINKSRRQQKPPIESQFTTGLIDNLNAEIALGTVTNIEEAVKWLSYTFLHVRYIYIYI